MWRWCSRVCHFFTSIDREGALTRQKARYAAFLEAGGRDRTAGSGKRAAMGELIRAGAAHP
jgi:hypothetical protein